MVAGAEELSRRFAGDRAELADEVRLVEVSCVGRKLSERHARTMQADRMAQANDRGEALWREAHRMAENDRLGVLQQIGAVALVATAHD